MAGMSPADVDLAMVYDAFTINTILFLEDLGFCSKGEGGRFVGGGLSCVHPGMYGMFLIVEAVTQLRGTAGERQLPRCDVALCHGNGGTLASQVTALLGNAATV